MTDRKSTNSNITLCRYWVKPGKEPAFRELLAKHWPTFQKLGLVTDTIPHLILRGEDKERGVFFIETFPWKDGESSQRAHALPEIAAIWEPMGDCCTSMEFPAVEVIHA